MAMHRHLERAAFLATIGAAILAIVALEALLQHIWQEPRFYRWATIAGVAIIALAFALIVAWWIDSARELTENLACARTRSRG